MAQIMNKINVYISQLMKRFRINIYDVLLKHHESKRRFKKDLIEIKKDEFEIRKEKRIKKVQLKYLHQLSVFESKAGIESDYVINKIQEQVKDVEDKFYWKHRVIDQKIKRAPNEQSKNNLKSKKEVLFSNQASMIKAIKGRLLNPNPSALDKQMYTEKKTLLDQKKQETISLIEKKHEERLNRMISKTEEEVKKHSDKVASYQKEVVSLEKTLKDKKDQVILDEGVILSLNNLSMHFGGLKAVDQLSFDVKEGEIFGLIGPNGAGKTTVFNCITRFYKPTSGHMYFKNANKKTIHLNDVAVHNIIKEGIVRTFQNVELVWELSILDNLLVAAHSIYRSSFFGHSVHSRLTKREETVFTKRAMKILADLDLTPYTHAFPIGLPYGVLKKVELARTLMSNPKLIILDEPAAGLNDSETKDLAGVIKKIKEEYNVTIFLVEHDMGLVMSICDTVCAISFGQKLAIGTPKEIQKSKVVQEAYLGGE